MIIHAGFLLLVLISVKTADPNEVEYNAHIDNAIEQLYSNKLTQLQKREVDGSAPKSTENEAKTLTNVNNTAKSIPLNTSNSSAREPSPDSVTNALSEGGVINVNAPPVHLETSPGNNTKVDIVNATKINTQNSTNVSKVNDTSSSTTNTLLKNSTINNSTDTENLLHNPGVVKRGLIVFGGFALLAAAYFIFYRKKGKKYDANNSHNTNDTNQFRYGVLQSEDRRDNLELSRVPLTMESDDDEEEDLEIFDLEQKKKSLSYVNLQTNDEDIVLHSSKDESKNNLLLDIEDGPSDTLINWSNTGNNSIL